MNYILSQLEGVELLKLDHLFPIMFMVMMEILPVFLLQENLEEVVELLLAERAEKENCQLLGKDLPVDPVEVDIEEVLEDLQLVLAVEVQM